MWPRKQLDIDWADFAFGLRCCLTPRDQPQNTASIPADWIAPQEALVSLSVRTGWDLLIAALQLPPGSEIIMSEVTIPDMARIVEHHGLVPVPVAVAPVRLEPNLSDLEQCISPRTRAILVAHLFGSRIEMDPIVELARQHHIPVFEDCAQAFVGRRYAGHALSDCSLFSFGPIKTASALGGAVLRVRDSSLRGRMASIQRDYPLQSRRAYAARLLKYLSLRFLSKRPIYGALVRGYGALGIDYDQAFSHAAHSFGQHNFFERIRRRPCPPLLKLLARRITTFENRTQARLRRRAEGGRALAATLPDGMVVGSQNESHTYWAMPIRVENGQEVIAALGEAGFDATARSSLVVLPDPHANHVDKGKPAHWLSETVFLPNGDDIPEDEWLRMALLIGKFARLAPRPAASPRRRNAVSSSVPV